MVKGDKSAEALLIYTRCKHGSCRKKALRKYMYCKDHINMDIFEEIFSNEWNEKFRTLNIKKNIRIGGGYE